MVETLTIFEDAGAGKYLSKLPLVVFLVLAAVTSPPMHRRERLVTYLVSSCLAGMFKFVEFYYDRIHQLSCIAFVGGVSHFVAFRGVYVIDIAQTVIHVRSSTI